MRRLWGVFRFAAGAALTLALSLAVFGADWFPASAPEAIPLNRTPYPSSSSSAALALTPDGLLLAVVNPDSNSVSLLNTTDLSLLAEIPVGLDPRALAISPDGSRGFVANQGSDDLSILDLASRMALGRIPVGDRPFAVALSPNGRTLAVAELGTDRVRFLDAASLRTLSVQPTADRPSGLAFTPDGDRLLVSHLLSGSVTLLPVQPWRVNLPLVQQSAPPAPTLRPPARNEPALHGAEIPTWPNVAPAPGVLVNAAGTRAYLPQTMANGLGLNVQFDTTLFPKISVLNLDTDQHQTSEHISLPETDQPVGLPWAAALAKDDSELWVVHSASNDVSVIDIGTPTAPQRVAHIPVGDNPRGIALSPDGDTAYVNNTLAGTVSVIDAQAYTVTQVITVTQIPLPPVLLQGKRLFYSSARPDLAQAKWISCASCHVEAEHDGRTWLLQYLGPVPPGEDPLVLRNTTSLLGMIETYPLRWSAEWDESADSEFSVRFEQFGEGLIHGGEMNPTLGPPNQGRSPDLDALAAFIDSLVIPASTRPWTPAAQRGRDLFESPATGCQDCHPPPLYTDLQVHDVGTADGPQEHFGPWIDTPTLRFLFDSAPYLHDGSAADLYEVLTTANPGDEHGVTSHLTPQELDDLVTFLLALPYDQP